MFTHSHEDDEDGDGQRFYGRYETREAAVAKALGECLNGDHGAGKDKFWVGKVVPLMLENHLRITVADIEEDVICAVEDDLGDAEDADFYIPAEKKFEADKALQAAILGVLRQFGANEQLGNKVDEIMSYQVVNGKAVCLDSSVT